MIIHEHNLQWYTEKLRNRDYFSQGMYGDGEWQAILHEHIGGANAEGTVYTQELCDELEKSLFFKSENFYFSTPAVIRNPAWSGIGELKIDKFLEERNLEIEFVEKDMWDREFRECRAAPFIRQLCEMNVVVVGNAALRDLTFLNYDKFIEVSYPNSHKDLHRIVGECLEYGRSAVYLFSMGLPATLAIQLLHNRIRDSFFLDVGSIWDTFVGIGRQRGFRAELYADQPRWEEWKMKNLEGI